jgi:2-dehydropantoate 2-reductase
MEQADFAILGAGALGSIIGAHLARAGQRVLMLTRAQRAQQIRQMGLRIRGLAEFDQPVAVLTEPAQLRAAGVLVVALKTHATAAALPALQGASIDTALSIQNGLIKNAQLAAAFGAERVLGALADTSGELLASGETLFTRNGNIYLGELAGGASARAQRIAGILDAAGVRSSAVVDIDSLEWSKFAAWAGLMILSVTTRAPTWQYAVDPGSALLLARLVREVGELAAARHIRLSDQGILPVARICRDSESQAVAVIQHFGRELRARAPQHRMSSLQDLLAGRALEIEETLGHALQLAQQSGLSLPQLSAFYPLVAAIDRIERRTAPDRT